jgi:O-Antigen ligase
MNSTEHSDEDFFARLPHLRAPASVLPLAAALGVVASAVLSASGRYYEAAAAVAIMLLLGFILSARIPVEIILIAWFATTPVASFFIRFPADKSIITFNRAAIAVAVIALAFGRKDKAEDSRFRATGFEAAWLLLSVIALASALARSNDLPYALRIAVDTFLLPLVLFHIARHRFDARGRGSQLLMGAVAVSLFLFVTGAYEIITGSNLFQYKGSELVREWALRVNGPFASDSSYAIISLLFALFLIAAPQLLKAKMDRSARLIYRCAVAAAVAAALLPLFRMVAVALVVSLTFFKLATALKSKSREAEGADSRNGESRILAGSYSHLFNSSPLQWLGLVVLAVAIWVVMFGPYSTERRLTDPRSAYGRLATWESAASLALDNPLLGVGLANYSDAFNAKYNFRGEIKLEVMETRAADSPHSNWLWVAADLGLPALALYAAANLSLMLMGLRALRRARGARTQAAAVGFVALLIAYWLPGLTLASGYYSDLNLYFFFMLGLLSNRSLVSGL